MKKLGYVDGVMYMLGKIMLGVLIVFWVIYLISGFSIIRFSFYCNFERFTGYPCPGCGGTRAARALVDGDLIKSLYYYPALIYGVLAYTYFMFRSFIWKNVVFLKYNALSLKKSDDEPKVRMKIDRLESLIQKYRDGVALKLLYIGIGIVLVSWIVKVVAQAVFGYYWFT